MAEPADGAPDTPGRGAAPDRPQAPTIQAPTIQAPTIQAPTTRTPTTSPPATATARSAPAGDGGFPQDAAPLLAPAGPVFVPPPLAQRGAAPAPAPEPAAAPTVTVTIGRIEVRAVTDPAPPAPTRAERAAQRAVSLEEYLRQRSRGHRA